LKEQNLIRYSIQLAFLKQLLERKLITDREYSLIKQRLMKDYRVVSELSS
jgi:transcriptional regulator CtsR